MIANRIYEWAHSDPTRTALIYNDVSLDYASFARSIEAVRGFLQTQDLPSGQTAIVLVLDHVDAWMLAIALRMLGLNTVCVPSLAQAERLDLKDVAAVVVTQSEQPLHKFHGRVLAGTKVVTVPATVRENVRAGDVPRPRQDPPAFGAHILYTSGTTGTYKKVLMTGAYENERNAMRAHALAFARSTVHHGIDFGLWTGAGFKQPSAVWYVGGCVVFDTRPNKFEHFFRHGITTAALLPPMVKMLLDACAGADISPKCAQGAELAVMSGFLPLELAQKAARELTQTLKIRYSATELIGIPLESVFETKDDLYWLSIMEGCTVQVVDENGNECPPGQEGELRVLITELDCNSYLDDGDAGANVFRDGFFYPGDMAVGRADGRIRVLGRISDVLNIQGQKFAVAPLEEAIQNRLRVDEVCLFSGLNDAGNEELVIAIQSDMEPPKTEMEAVVRIFSAFERVRFAVLKEFPRTEAGTRKTQRAALRKLVFAARESSV